MANYALTRYTTDQENTVAEVLAALETKMETVTDTKTIRGIGIQLTGRDREQAIGYVIYDT